MKLFGLDLLALLIVALAGIYWGLVGLIGFDPLGVSGRGGYVLLRAIYIIIGGISVFVLVRSARLAHELPPREHVHPV